MDNGTFRLLYVKENGDVHMVGLDEEQSILLNYIVHGGILGEEIFISKEIVGHTKKELDEDGSREG